MTTKDSEELFWNPEEYRLDVWEGEEGTWHTRRINEKGQGSINTGDIVIFFFSKSRTKDCGIYGWAIITEFDAEKGQISFIPTSPSDYLKTSPVWNKDIEDLIDQIRVPIPQGTMWSVTLDELNIIRAAIKHHLGYGV
jgi:hypothetical protein